MPLEEHYCGDEAFARLALVPDPVLDAQLETWLTKAARRGLISTESCATYETDITQIGRMLNAYIKSIGENTQSLRVRESSPDYLPDLSPLTNNQ